VWLEEAQLGLGLWYGEYQGFDRLWLRWYDLEGNRILTPTEIAEQERQIADQERLKVKELEALLAHCQERFGNLE
jgi:hypothetical protein